MSQPAEAIMNSMNKTRYNVVVQKPEASTDIRSSVVEDLLRDSFNLVGNNGRVNVSLESASQDYPVTFKEYWHDLRRTIKTRFDELKDEDDSPDPLSTEFAHTLAEDLVEGSKLVNDYSRAVIYHCDNGFHNEGGVRYISNGEFEDARDMTTALAAAGYYNDVLFMTYLLQDTRKTLGYAIQLIEPDAVYSEGYKTEYEYEKGLRDPEIRPYTFEHLGGNEWRMFDPNGDAFEVISPDAKLDEYDEDDLDWSMPEVRLELWLDNICARREREIE